MRPTLVGLLLLCLSGCDGGLLGDSGILSETEATLGEADTALARRDYAVANSLYTDALVAVLASEEQTQAAYLGRGKARVGLGRAEEAVADFTAVLNRDATNRAALLGRADAYRMLDDYPLALLDLTAVIRQNPSYPDAFISRGALHAQMAAFPKAIADFDHALKLGGRPEPEQLASALVGRAGAHKKVGTYSAAIQDYSRAIELVGSEPAYHAGRGIAYLEIGMLEEGIADLSRAGGVTIDDFLGHAKAVGQISFPEFAPQDWAGVPDSTLKKFAGFARVSGGLWANDQCEHLDGAQKLGFEFEAEKNEQHIRDVYRSLLGVDEKAAEMFLDALRKIGVAYALDQSNECGEPSRRLVSDGLVEAVCLNVFFDGTQFEGCDY